MALGKGEKEEENPTITVNTNCKTISSSKGIQPKPAASSAPLLSLPPQRREEQHHVGKLTIP